MNISLYEFTLGPIVWRYAASGDDILDTAGNTWTAAAISHERINQSGEAVADGGKLVADRNLLPCLIWLASPPSRSMSLRILTVATAQPDESYGDGLIDSVVSRTLNVSTPLVQYKGEIVQCSANSPESVVFDVETLSATMNQAGLRLGWQRQCPHALFDPKTCKVDKSLYQIDTVINEVNGALVTVPLSPDFIDGFFDAGLLEFTHPVKGEESLTIELNNSNVLLIFGSTRDLYPGLAIRLYRGCSQTPESCQSFDNYNNYGGFPHMTGKSPFNGVDSPIF